MFRRFIFATYYFVDFLTSAFFSILGIKRRNKLLKKRANLSDYDFGPEHAPSKNKDYTICEDMDRFFNSQLNLWLDFKNQIQEGDELWEYSTPWVTWMFMCGRGGICIVRQGEIIANYMTKMN